ncbi:MAG TPA: PAS domain S-box protein [Gemmatirosa sp.]
MNDPQHRASSATTTDNPITTRATSDAMTPDTVASDGVTPERALALALGDAGLRTWRWEIADDSSTATSVHASADSPPERWPPGTARATLLSRVHPDDRAQVNAAMDAAVSGASDTYHAEIRVAAPDGSIAHVATNGRVVRDEHGRPTAVVGVASDVTAQRTAEAALAESSAKLRAVLDAAPMAVIAIDADLRVTMWNAGAERLLGYTADEVLDRPSPILPDDATERELRDAVGRCTRAVAAGEVCPTADAPYDTIRRAKDGTLIDVTVSSGVLRDGAGAVVGYVGMIADARERKRLEAELRQAQKMEAVGRLAGGIAHDFNNLLTVIRAGADLILDDVPEDSPVAADARDVRAAADRAAGLTRQLLAFSRRQKLAPRPLDVNAVVRALEPMLRRLIGTDIELVTLLDHEPLGVLADPSQLEQVVLHRAVNARDAMPDGGVLVIETARRAINARQGSRLAAPVPAGDYAVLEVTDTGAGMSAPVRARVFEPFFTTKPPASGTGLGLATVYGIVTQSGGGLDVRSVEGRGSTFGVLLPRRPLGATAPTAVATASGPSEAVAGTILVVEDESAVRSTVRRVLERLGHRVLEARHGRDALDLLRRADGPSVGLVLTDVTMPEMGGRALVEQLAAERPELPVLVMSGYAATAAGVAASDVILKPFTADALAARVERALAAVSR